MPELTRLYIELERAVTDAFDFFHVVSDFLEHAADLPVASFDQGDFVPRVCGFLDELNARRRSLN